MSEENYDPATVGTQRSRRFNLHFRDTARAPVAGSYISRLPVRFEIVNATAFSVARSIRDTERSEKLLLLRVNTRHRAEGYY